MNAIVLRGLNFGDEGKGTVVDFFARKYGIEAVIRDNGGPQAGHNVVDAKGRQHVFSQFGSATLVDGTTTYLSDGMLVQPMNLLRENDALRKIGVNDALERIFIDPDCVIVTPLHKMIGQMLEVSRGMNRLGSVGMGVGQAVLDRKNNAALTFRDFFDKDELTRKLQRHITDKMAQAEEIVGEHMGNTELSECFERFEHWISRDKLVASYAGFGEHFENLFLEPDNFFETLSEGDDVIFEGAQGALLDPVNGFVPYVTKTRTTSIAAEHLIERYLPKANVKKVGVIRAYFTRHGPGFFMTEVSRLSDKLADSQNKTHPWQGKFRVGWFDLVAARYGIAINGGMDSIALTNLDRLSEFAKIPVCTAYEYSGDCEDVVDDFFEWHRERGVYILDRFKPPGAQHNGRRLAKILFESHPTKHVVMKGWQKDISGVKSFRRLPKEAKTYVRFLESADGLGIPISIVSVGERSDQKIVINDPC